MHTQHGWEISAYLVDDGAQAKLVCQGSADLAPIGMRDWHFGGNGGTLALDVRAGVVFADHDFENKGSWKSSTLAQETGRSTKRKVYAVTATTLGEALTDAHTIVKIDSGGSEMGLLTEEQDWKQVHTLIFEWSPARCRRFSTG